MKIVHKGSRTVQFCTLLEGEVFLDTDDIPYMKMRLHNGFNAARLSDGLWDSFALDTFVKACPDAFLTLEGD